MRCALIKSTTKTMSKQTIPHAVQQQHAIAWLRIKMLLGFCFHLLARVFGWILVVSASLGLAGTLISWVFGPLDFGAVKISAPVMILDGSGKRIDGPWWSVALLFLFYLFILAWGADIVRLGHKKHSPTS
jgi:hypothetical protein